MSRANGAVRRVAKAIVAVELSPDHAGCRIPAYCMARAAIKEYDRPAPPDRIRWKKSKGAIAELHGDQLYGWFREKFRGHKDSLTLRECRAMFRYAVENAREMER